MDKVFAYGAACLKTPPKPQKPAAKSPLPTTGRVRIQDVARVANVSLSTVSGVLNSKANVRPETRTRVLQVIAQLGYAPNLFASNLARRRTSLIGIVVSDLLNPFFAEIAAALDDEARSRGFQTFLTSTRFDPRQQHEAVRQMLALRVAGVAMMTSENDPEAYALLEQSRTPAVYLDNTHLAPEIGTVHVNKRHGMFLAVRHLLELGHRSILLIKNSQSAATGAPMLSHLERQLGFNEALHAYDPREVDVQIIDEVGEPTAAGLRAVQKALGQFRFTAVVCMNDLVALGAIRGLQAAGLHIPNDVSVVGFDNTYLCEFLHPPLTTVASPRKELANSVLNMLLGFVEKEEVPHEVSLSTELRLRESTTKPPARN